MKKTYSSFEENYLVPAVLILINICVVHVVYAVAASFYALPAKIVLTLAFILFGASLFSKGKLILIGAILFYGFAIAYLIIT